MTSGAQTWEATEARRGPEAFSRTTAKENVLRTGGRAFEGIANELIIVNDRDDWLFAQTVLRHLVGSQRSTVKNRSLVLML